MRERVSSSKAWLSSAVLFLLLAHLPFLGAPYFWDEVGQYIPASLDLFYRGQIVPHSTIPNVHPPGVMLYLATVWRLFGYSIPATRLAMLAFAILACWCTWRLAADFLCPDRKAAAMTLVLLCLSPLFFSQSMMVLLDMPAMAFTLLGLLLFLEDRIVQSALVCVLLVLVKETGALLPAVLGCVLAFEHRRRRAIWFMLPAIPLAAWLLILHTHTGSWFGNAPFARYNLTYPLNPIRFTLALARRFYYLFLGTGYFIGTITLSQSRAKFLHSRPWRIACTFLIVHVIAMCLLGGAVLERYLLPVLPITLAAFAASGLRPLAFAAMCALSAASIFINPIYPFPLENNLAWIDYVNVQRDAARSLHGPYIASAFPFAGCLRRPEFGYTEQRFIVDEIPDFNPESVQRLHNHRIDAFAIFDSTWDPLGLMRNPHWIAFLERVYDYQQAVAPEQIPSMLRLHLVKHFERHGQWIDTFEP